MRIRKRKGFVSARAIEQAGEQMKNVGAHTEKSLIDALEESYQVRIGNQMGGDMIARAPGEDSPFFEGARVREIVESRLLRRGAGTADDPVRFVTQYHTKKGELLAEMDAMVGSSAAGLYKIASDEVARLYVRLRETHEGLKTEIRLRREREVEIARLKKTAKRLRSWLKARSA